MIDLQEVERIKEKLNASPEDYQEIINSSKLAICITDEDANFFAMNNNYLKLYGYSREELTGKSFLTVVPDGMKDKLKDLHDIFLVMKDEIMRNWEVQDSSGRVFKIFADAGYSETISGKPTKITFVWPNDDEKLQLLQG